jgi:hypothetical protein
MRLMYDAVTAAHIPAGARMVAGYVDGRYRWTDADWALFPDAIKVRIAVFPTTGDGQVLDVERWDARPDQAPVWVVNRRLAGEDPSVYCDESRWPTVRAAFVAARVREPHYWLAAVPGDAGIPVGAIAHQYAATGLVDLSLVADYWPGVDPPPAPNPKEPPTHMAKTALPAGANPVKGSSQSWKPDASQLDLFLLGADGHLYHYWWEVAPGVWSGPELIDGPG